MSDSVTDNELISSAAVSIQARVSPSVNIVDYDNGVELLHELTIKNSAGDELESLVLELNTIPAILESREWRVDIVPGNSDHSFHELSLVVDSSLLRGITERQIADIEFTLKSSDQLIATTKEKISLLPRNHWTGLASHLPEIVTAFAQPNDPAIDKLLKQTSDILNSNGRKSQLDGYEGGPNRAWELVNAIWNSVASLNFTYIYPPASFEQSGQKIRTPDSLMESRVGTCLDLTLLFVALMEQVSLNSVIVFTKGHAFPGFWVDKDKLPTTSSDDPSQLRNSIELNKLVLFESTLVTGPQPSTFTEAVRRGANNISIDHPENFILAVDVRQSRTSGIHPLASLELSSKRDADSGVLPKNDLALEAPPVEFHSANPSEDETVPATPQGKINHWQKKLLDLSLRNKLLNFTTNKKSLRIEISSANDLEIALSTNNKLRFESTPTMTKSRDAVAQARLESLNSEELTSARIDAALKAKTLLVDQPLESIETTLLGLFRDAKTANEEGGSNTLFLSFGYLSWNRPEDSSRKYLAPILMVPVVLDRTTARSGFSIRAHDDEPRINPTLIQMLRQDFNLSLPLTDADISPENGEINVELIWRKIRQAIQYKNGWEVVERVHLTTFSFSKYLMWKDLVDRTEELSKNLVVNQLLEGKVEGFPDQGNFPNENELDTRYSPETVFAPLPADSTQLATILAARDGKNFVVIGPPGTGKSQTISNIISQTLAQGKTILFVSEKIAALDVVHRRLREIELGEFCLELHSNKANKKNVLNQLDTAWHSGNHAGSSTDWKENTERLSVARRNLNLYVEELHRIHPNGLSIFDAFGTISGSKNLPTLKLAKQPDVNDSKKVRVAPQLAAAGIQDAASRLSRNDFQNPALQLIGRSEWSLQFNDDATLHARELKLAFAEAINKLRRFHESFGSTPDSWTPELIRATIQLAASLKSVPESVIPDVASRYVNSQLDLIEKATNLATQVEFIEESLRSMWSAERIDESTVPQIVELQRAVSQLSVPYTSTVEHANLSDTRQRWEAASKRWFFKGKAKKEVQEGFAKFTRDGAVPIIDRDLDLLENIFNLKTSIEEHRNDLTKQLGKLPPMPEYAKGVWNGSKTNLDHVQWNRDFASTLTQFVGFCPRSSEDAIRAKIAQILSGDRVTRNSFIDLAAELESNSISVTKSNQRIFATLETPHDRARSFESIDLKSRLHVIESLESGELDLRAWCQWQAARESAALVGLDDLVGKIESGELSHDMAVSTYDVNYCRLWVRKMIDSVAPIRNFLGETHERQIVDFRNLDQIYAKLTAEVVKERVIHRTPSYIEGGRKSEAGILRHEIGKQRRHKPIRQLMSEIPKLITKIAPCFMMSPLSIAQYLPANSELFDVVVFDEASQIPVWDAVGAIARGKQVIMVGDQKQLPPTSFFNRADNTEPDEDFQEDLESILDECVTSSMPVRSLSWHYRSRHESLIAFSNRKYYDGKLITFPSPVTEDTAVNSVWVDGVYERGSGPDSRTNPIEARAVVERVISQLKQYPEQSLGVVTFNMAQYSLIDTLLQEERIKDPSLEQFFSPEKTEPVMVKNLEQVQGDERDVMFFSTTFGRDSAGKMYMNFGPLNKSGGERRLNVAITRARRELVVVTSMKPEDMDLSRTKAVGVKDFKTFLDYANRGVRAMDAEVEGDQGDPDSPFEASVAAALRKRGWDVNLQIGVSGFRVDMGVVDPDASGAYLAGIECDGATYHRSATARDRDQIRESVLRGLGWEILRVWSTDWFLNERNVLDKLDIALRKLQEQSRANRIAEKELAKNSEEKSDHLTSDSAQVAPAQDLPEVELVAGVTTNTHSSNHPTHRKEELQGVGSRAINLYPNINPGNLVISPDGFYDGAYDQTLGMIISRIVQLQGPIREANLIGTIRSWHGWGRAGNRIRTRILDAVPASVSRITEEDGTVFFWPSNSNPKRTVPFRRPESAEARRLVSEISMQELKGLVEELRHRTDDHEKLVELMCEAIPIERLSASARVRLENAINEII